MGLYFDKTLFSNPLYKYVKWLSCKIKYQLKYWGKHLRINYDCMVYNSSFGKNNWLGSASLISNSTFGDFTYCGIQCDIKNATIGKFCSIGPHVTIAPGKHPSTHRVSTHPSTYNNQPNLAKNFVSDNTYKSFEQVIIGNDVWIGTNSIIIDGIVIGDGAIIAANSVVTKNVNSYEIVGGVPAKFIKKRFSDEQINLLNEIGWWHKDEQWIEKNISKFESIEDFLENRTIDN